jgi:hypothetical protein
MKTHNLPRSFRIFVVVAFLLSISYMPAVAAPAAPTPVSPAEGGTVVIPTFSWLASAGAVEYEVEVGPQSDPNTVLWTTRTVNLTITPNNASVFINGLLYWRVRGFDSSAIAGTWSSKINFTKQIPAPALVSPADTSSNVKVPTLEWSSVQGAVTYLVEMSTVPGFVPLEASYITYNTRITPINTLVHGIHYWRVSGVDADGHVGTASAYRSFIKGIPAPTLVSPANDHLDIHVPTLEWQAVQGAAYYTVELSTVSNFTPVEVSYETYNTRITPITTLAPGKHYWRVSGVDADGHVGTSSDAWSFTIFMDAPALVSPASDASVTVPTLEWQAVEGAAYYQVEISTASNFSLDLVTYTTYNLRFTPADALALNMYYWRVSGVDADGHLGASDWRRFTLVAPPAASDTIPQLSTPADAETIPSDPTFTWTRVNNAGIDHYRIIVSKQSGFSSIYNSVTTDYTSYTPYTPKSPSNYPNGTYYWKVEARTSGGTILATSAARSFTKQEPMTLAAPANAAALVNDPTFQWDQFVGAHHYRLIVSVDSDFSSILHSLSTDYNSYTPYPATTSSTYPNGTYYWKVEARTSGGTVLATSAGRSFTKQEPLSLAAPEDAAAPTVDPTFQWTQFVGAHHYRLVISNAGDFSSTYASLNTDHTSYTPYPAGDPNSLINGTYYWKVEARTIGGTVIATSNARTFTRQESLALIAPINGKKLNTTPTLQWSQVIGAHHYHLIVSTKNDFSSTYDSLSDDYTTYTPYAAASLAKYADNTYYWKVEARTSSEAVVASSNTWVFTISHWLYLPLIIR